MPQPPKRAPGPPLASPERRAVNRLDQVLIEAETSLARASAEQANNGDPEELVLELLAKVAGLRDVTVGLLREHHCGQSRLALLFGHGGTRLDRIFAVIDAELLDEHEQDESVQGCLEACQSVQHILETSGLEVEPLQRCPSDQEPFRQSPVPPAADELLPDLPSPERDKGSEGGGSEETLPSVDSEGQLPPFSPGGLGEWPVDCDQWPTGGPPLTPREEPESGASSPEPTVEDEWASLAGNSMEKVPEDAPQTPPPCKREEHEHIFTSGGKYRGEWLDGLRDGYGTQSWPGGEHYEGQFRRGGVHGEGVYSQPDGMCHRGQWARGKQHGHGSETFPDGTKYIGQYVAGSKSGNGMYTFAEGSVYEGQFLDNAIDGHGTYIWAGGGNGRKYHGQWSKNQMHGFGEFTFADGRRYSGEYVHDQKSGEGTFTWPDGREYSGQWLRGKQHGKARYKDASGEVRIGTWSEGKPKRIMV